MPVCRGEIKRLVDELKEYAETISEYRIVEHNCSIHNIREECEARAGYREELRIISGSIREAAERLCTCLERR